MTEHLEDRLDDGPRTVLVRSRMAYSIESVRDDLRTASSKETVSRVIETFRGNDPLFSPDIKEEPVGKRRAVVHDHEHAFVLQFPSADSETSLVSAEGDVGRDLLACIATCRRLVEDDAERVAGSR